MIGMGSYRGVVGFLASVALASGLAVWIAVWGTRAVFNHVPSQVLLHHSKIYDLFALTIGIIIWLAITKEILDKTGSALPRVAMSRLKFK